MRIALTGATGYTGGRLLARLRADGHQVVALARAAAGPPAPAGGVRWVEGDLRDTDALRRLVEGVDAVVHVAAVYRTAGHPDSYYRDVNVGGTERLLDAAARAGVRRFVHTSTVGVHGDVKEPPADETAPIAPGDIYQRTKAEAEARLLKLFRAIARGRYAIVGSGRAFYHPVFIEDLLDGYELALERPQAVGEAFILAGPRYVSQKELAALIARHTGGRVLPLRVPAAPLQLLGDLCEALCVPFGVEPPLHRRRVDFWTKSRAFSIGKARQVLGYAPRVDVDEGVARTVAWYREAGWL
jgi:dihydroflavonol-4-reductase